MDFRDISKFKPSLDLKRAADDDDDDDDVAAGTGAKRARTADGGSSGAAAAAAAAATTDHRAAEAAAAEAGIDLSLLSAEERARVLEMLEADDEVRLHAVHMRADGPSAAPAAGDDLRAALPARRFARRPCISQTYPHTHIHHADTLSLLLTNGSCPPQG